MRDVDNLLSGRHPQPVARLGGVDQKLHQLAPLVACAVRVEQLERDDREAASIVVEAQEIVERLLGGGIEIDRIVPRRAEVLPGRTRVDQPLYAGTDHGLDKPRGEQDVGQDEILALLGPMLGQVQRREMEDDVRPRFSDDRRQVGVRCVQSMHGGALQPGTDLACLANEQVHLMPIAQQAARKPLADEPGRPSDQRPVAHPPTPSIVKGVTKSAKAE